MIAGFEYLTTLPQLTDLSNMNYHTDDSQLDKALPNNIMYTHIIPLFLKSNIGIHGDNYLLSDTAA